MKLYRITLKPYGHLEGTGRIYGPGRWHRVVYLSENISLAAWEKMINLASTTLLPTNLVLTEVSVPAIKAANVPGEVLVKGWDDFPYLDATMTFGTDFLAENKHLLLRVPSAVIKKE